VLKDSHQKPDSLDDLSPYILDINLVAYIASLCHCVVGGGEGWGWVYGRGGEWRNANNEACAL